MNIAAPAGAIVSTPRDMARWMMWHLSGGAVPPSGQSETPARRLIAQDRLWETYRGRNMAFSRHGEHTSTNASERHVAYDLGWITSYYRGTELLFSYHDTVQVYRQEGCLWPWSLVAVLGPGLCLQF